jgi:hypothetical protein
MMYPPPPRIRARRFSAEVKPRSATQMTLDRVHSRRSFLTWRIRPESAVFPGQDQTRTGIPSRVTAMPTMTWGSSSRESLDFPCARNPASPALSSLPGATASPRALRSMSSSASFVSK